jgi:peptidoglycan/xylan/chitin deacetylase (PgdA/CDA1 family)
VETQFWNPNGDIVSKNKRSDGYMMVIALLSITIIIFILMIGLMIFTSPHISLIHTTYAKKNKSANNSVNNDGGSGDNSNNIANQDQSNIAAINNKVVILTFGDIHKSQYTTAKPILDQYGFKGSFFVTCDMVGKDSQMDWQEIDTLHHEGHDIEAKSADDLIKLPADQLNSQVSQSKQCLLGHGINNPATFAVPQGNAVDNSTVIESIAKYYDFAINGFSPLMRLDCNNDHTGCAIYSDSGQLTNLNRYSIREWSHNANDKKYDYNSTAIFNKFLDVVDSQFKYNDNNNDGVINAIPLIAYHSIDSDRTSSSTDIDLFAAEMKYLHDNGFKVLTMHNIGYDQNNGRLYVKAPGTESGTPNPNSLSLYPVF